MGTLLRFVQSLLSAVFATFGMPVMAGTVGAGTSAHIQEFGNGDENDEGSAPAFLKAEEEYEYSEMFKSWEGNGLFSR